MQSLEGGEDLSNVFLFKANAVVFDNYLDATLKSGRPGDLDDRLFISFVELEGVPNKVLESCRI